MKLKALACSSLLVLVASIAAAQHSQSLLKPLRRGSAVNWPQFHFDPGLTGYNPYESILSPANVGSVTLKWSYAPSEGNGVTGAPTIANGIMYFGLAYTGLSNSRNDRIDSYSWAVYALDANTGTFLWKYATEPIFGSPAVANGMVYVIDADYLYALDASTGALIWQFDVPGGADFCSPTIVNNILYFTDPAKAVYALNATNGALIWKYATAAANSSPPAVANGLVYVNGGAGIVTALNASTGALIWKKQFGSNIGPPPSLGGTVAGQAVADGVLYVPIQRKPNLYDLYALDASTGAVIWRTALGGVGAGQTPAVANGMVYVASDKIYALNAQTGAVIWQVQDYGNSPNVANGVLYTAHLGIPAEGAVYGVLVAYDANSGAFLWQYKTDLGGFNSFLYPSPVVVNGMIYGSLIGSPNQVGAFSLPN